MAEPSRRNPLLASLSVVVMAALFGLPFLQVAPNRLVSGQAIHLFAVAPGYVWSLLAILCAAALITVFRPHRRWLYAVLVSSVVLMPSLLWQAAIHADSVAQVESALVRTSFGAAFWLGLVLLAFLAHSALEQLRASAVQRVAVGAAVVLCFWALLSSGICDNLSLVKEYTQRAEVFKLLLIRHLQIVFLALLATLCIGGLLGWLAHVHAKAGRVLLPVLNIIQTIPSIALFGLLMLPLSWLAASLPALGRAGISGVGLAPAVIALTLYGLLPVVRSILAGLQQVSPAMRSAASALGLRRLQVLTSVELPLALPVLLGGIRTAAVASIGLAAVTALIGAGGLGSILFEGLFSNAQDLVLLGVLPIVALGMLVDALFKVLIKLASQMARLV